MVFNVLWLWWHIDIGIYILQTSQLNPIFVSGHTEILSTGFKGTETSAGKIALGVYKGMYAYQGWWEQLNIEISTLNHTIRSIDHEKIQLFLKCIL